MSDVDLERALARVCFDAEPSRDDLAALGEGRWSLYREMVRRRFASLLGDAMPRSRAVLGDALLERLSNALLAEAPPRTRYLREYTPLVVDFAARRADLLADAPAWAMDLLRWESAALSAAIADDPPTTGLVAFDMALTPALAPSCRLVELAWSVHRDAREPAPERATLLLYRAASEHRVETMVLNDVAAAITRALLDGGGSAAERVGAAMAACGAGASEAFIEALADLLDDYLTRGVIVGSVPAV